MFAINYARVGQDALADQYFQRGWVNNSLGDFYLWHEVC
jgi:hypothetical protein